MSKNFPREVTLPSGQAVMVRKVTREDMHDALAIVERNEYENLRAGRKNGAALIESLDLIVRLALMQRLDEDEPNDALLNLGNLPFDDKLAIFGFAYQVQTRKKIELTDTSGIARVSLMKPLQEANKDGN